MSDIQEEPKDRDYDKSDSGSELEPIEKVAYKADDKRLTAA